MTVEIVRKEIRRCREALERGDSPESWEKRLAEALVEVERMGYLLTEQLEAIRALPTKAPK